MNKNMDTKSTQIPKNDKKVEKKKKKKSKNRCACKECKTKLKISDMPCCCCKIYCAKHRAKHKHNCPIIETKNKDLWGDGLGGGNFKQIHSI
jgi:hypothetical protein